MRTKWAVAVWLRWALCACAVPIRKLASVQLVTPLNTMEHVQHSPEFAAR